MRRNSRSLGRRALEDLHLKELLVTRGKDGMALFRKRPAYAGDSDFWIGRGARCYRRRRYGDRRLYFGAGCRRHRFEAAHLANFAGGMVVMKRGTATVTRAELEDALRSAATSAG